MLCGGRFALLGHVHPPLHLLPARLGDADLLLLLLLELLLAELADGREVLLPQQISDFSAERFSR